MSKNTLFQTVLKSIGWILQLPIQLAKRFGRLLRMSISSKIIFGYLMMYLTVNLLIDCAVIGMFAWNIKDEIEVDGWVYYQEIQSRIVEDNSPLIAVKDILEGTDTYCIILDENGAVVGLENIERKAKYLHERYIQRRSELFGIDKWLSIAVDYLAYYPQRMSVSYGEQNYITLEFYHSSSPYLS